MSEDNGYRAMTVEQRLERLEAQMDRLDVFGRPAVGAIEQLEHRLNSSFAQVVFDMRKEIDAIKDTIGINHDRLPNDTGSAAEGQ